MNKDLKNTTGSAETHIKSLIELIPCKCHGKDPSVHKLALLSDTLDFKYYDASKSILNGSMSTIDNFVTSFHFECLNSNAFAYICTLLHQQTLIWYKKILFVA
ncbi:unnamed protein product [Schistosoma intercalatum]|nr:unnamed protein product [Schistosoma intercalatum]